MGSLPSKPSLRRHVQQARTCAGPSGLLAVPWLASQPPRQLPPLFLAGIIIFMSVLLSIGVRESALFITSKWLPGCRLHGSPPPASLRCCAQPPMRGAVLALPRPLRPSQGRLLTPGGEPAPGSTPMLCHAYLPLPAGATIVKIALIVFVAIVGFTRGTTATLYDPPAAPYAYTPEHGAANPAYTPLIKGPTHPFFHPVGTAAALPAALLLCLQGGVGWVVRLGWDGASGRRHPWMTGAGRPLVGGRPWRQQHHCSSYRLAPPVRRAELRGRRRLPGCRRPVLQLCGLRCDLQRR